MSRLALIVVPLLILLTIYGGLRDGAFFTAYALLRNLFAFLFALTLAEPMASLVGVFLGGAELAKSYYVLICFAGLWGAVFVAGRILKMHYTSPEIICPGLIDKLVGPALGLLNGYVLTGTLLILWSLFPFLAYIPADMGRIEIHSGILDSGAIMLRVYDVIQDDMGGGRAFLLHDEPIETDEDNDGMADPGESYKDLNGNGEWDHGWLYRYRNHAALEPGDLERLPGVFERGG